MSVYKQQVTKGYKSLTKSEQQNLFNAMRNGSKIARDTIISSCLPLVMNLADKFHINNKHIDIDDMIQEGNVALIKAVDNWDINKASITTVATYYIKNSLIDMISDSKYNIRHPYSMSRSAAQDLRKLEADPTRYIKQKRLIKLMSCRSQRVPIEYAQYIAAQEVDDIKEPCVIDLYEFCNQYLDGLDYKIFSMYIGVEGKRYKINQICDNLNMTQQDVKSIINKCKRRLARIAQYA